MLRLSVLALALLPLPAAAQSAPDDSAASAPAPAAELAGSWALKIDGATVFRFDIAPAGDGWKGSWHRPTSFASTGDSFSRLTEDSVAVESGDARSVGEWAELTFPDNRPHAIPDVFRFRPLGPDRLEMIYVGTGLAPFMLVRVPSEAPLGPFEPGRIYRRLTIEMLGLPADAPTAPPALAAPRKAQPDDPAWTLPPRQTDKPAAEGGR